MNYFSNMLQVSELFIYPIKSLGGIALSSSVVTDRGLQYDRRWMLVDDNNQFITQRTFPQMALLQVQLSGNGLTVYHKKNGSSIDIPFGSLEGEIKVGVWNDECKARLVSKEADEWFSEMLSLPCRLTYMPESARRRVDGRYARNKEITSLSDGYPFLLIGQSSLDDLNGRLEEPLPINRFRPNIVVSGGLPFEEDEWTEFSINDIPFYGVKLCARCVVTTINQDEAEKGKEPLKTLATYRMRDNNIYFGQNLTHQGQGIIRAGDRVDVIRRKPSKKFVLLS